MKITLIFKLSLFLTIGLLISCSTQSESSGSTKLLPTPCKQMAPVADIWKLEPILIKKGKIQEKMTRAEKEKAIRQYIKEKNNQYKICLKSTK